MGYTNYWTNKRSFTDDEWKKVKDEYEWLKEMGEGIIIDQTKLTSEIVFNGNPKDEQDHETFYINKANVYDGFSFCKTARKPYDALVNMTLELATEMLDGFSYSSDGENGDDENKEFLTKFMRNAKIDEVLEN